MSMSLNCINMPRLVYVCIHTHTHTHTYTVKSPPPPSSCIFFRSQFVGCTKKTLVPLIARCGLVVALATSMGLFRTCSPAFRENTTTRIHPVVLSHVLVAWERGQRVELKAFERQRSRRKRCATKTVLMRVQNSPSGTKIRESP